MAASKPINVYGDGLKESDSVAFQIEEFNRNLKRLACDLAVYYPTDAAINRIKKQLMLTIDLNPACAIDAVGPLLYTYRHQINAGDDSFFLQKEYNSDLSRCKHEKAEVIAYIIPKVKEAWGGEDADKKQMYREAVQDLLGTYVEYLYLTKIKASA